MCRVKYIAVSSDLCVCGGGGGGGGGGIIFLTLYIFFTFNSYVLLHFLKGMGG